MELVLFVIFISILSFAAASVIRRTISIRKHKQQLELIELYQEADVDFYNRMFQKPDLYYAICDQAYYEVQVLGETVNEVLSKYVWH